MPNSWDMGLPMAEFQYNSSAYRTTGCSPFEIATSLKPRKLVDLVPLPNIGSHSAEANRFANHIQEIHAGGQRKIASSKLIKYYAYLRCRHEEFEIGNQILVRV